MTAPTAAAASSVLSLALLLLDIAKRTVLLQIFSCRGFHAEEQAVPRVDEGEEGGGGRGCPKNKKHESA